MWPIGFLVMLVISIFWYGSRNTVVAEPFLQAIVNYGFWITFALTFFILFAGVVNALNRRR